MKIKHIVNGKEIISDVDIDMTHGNIIYDKERNKYITNYTDEEITEIWDKISNNK